MSSSKRKLAYLSFVIALLFIINKTSGLSGIWQMENNPAVSLIIIGDRYMFVGIGNEYRQLTDYLETKSGKLNMKLLHKKAHAQDSTIYCCDDFALTLTYDNILILTKDLALNYCYRFRK